MKKISIEKTKQINGGGYKCPNCAYVSPQDYGLREHVWAWHGKWLTKSELEKCKI